MPRRVKVFFDGGYRGDPPTMELAVVFGASATILTDLGPGSSTEAEWLALVHALEVAHALQLDHFVLIGDSAEVVAKANGAMRCRGTEARHLARFRELGSPSPPHVRHVKRSGNPAGAALARRHPR